MPDIKKKFAFQLLYAFSQILFPLITYPYLARTLGAASLGKIAFIEYCAGLIITIASIGIPFYGVREIAKAQTETQKKKITASLISLHFFSSLAGMAVFIFLCLNNPTVGEEAFLIALGSINILTTVFIAEWYMQGIEAFKLIAIRNICLRFIGLFLILYFVRSYVDYVTYYQIVVGVQVGVAFINFINIGSKGIALARVKELKTHIPPLFHFFLTSSIISLYVFFDVLILGWLTNAQSVGYYSTAIKIVKLSLLFVLSLNIILFPRISALSVKADLAAIKILLHKGLCFLILVTIPLGFIFFLLADELIAVLAGNAFLPSVPLIRIFSFLPLIIGVNNLFVYQILTPFGREKKLLLSVAVACFISIILQWNLTLLFSEMGTALATLITELLVTVLTGYFAFSTIRYTFPASAFFQSLISALPFILIIYGIKFLTQNSYLILLLSGGACLLVYAFFQLYLFKNEMSTQIWQSTKIFIRKSFSHA